MKIDQNWIQALCLKHGIKPKQVRDTLWPDEPTRGLSYFNKYKNIGLDYIIALADAIGCTTDELLGRKEIDTRPLLNGNNNSVGNVNISSPDVKTLTQTISSQKVIIKNQEREIKRLEEQMNRELKAKNDQIDRLIETLKGFGNQ